MNEHERCRRREGAHKQEIADRRIDAASSSNSSVSHGNLNTSDVEQQQQEQQQ
jgi:hypothetical protein